MTPPEFAAIVECMSAYGIDAAMEFAHARLGYRDEPNREGLRDMLLRMPEYRHRMDIDELPHGSLDTSPRP